MAIYFVTGKLGSGKTLASVGRIRDYLWARRRVASNLDLDIEKMIGPRSKRSVVRLPDKPTSEDLEALGMGSNELNENKYGAIVLDEVGTIFNSRTWQDKERQKIIDWFLHSRKKRWDIFFIVQNIGIIDRQLRDTLCEHMVVCTRTDRYKIPLVGSFLSAVGIRVQLPKFHIGKVYYGVTENRHTFLESWYYRATDLYSSYDTEQVFRDEIPVFDGELRIRKGSYSTVPPVAYCNHEKNGIKLKDVFLVPVRLFAILSIVIMVIVAACCSGRSPMQHVLQLQFGKKKNNRNRKQNTLPYPVMI